MRLGSPGRPHLTYCTNIHPGEGWAEVRQNLARFLPSVRERLGCRAPFGVGLRLSARAAEELEAEGVTALAGWLADSGLYVFTLNGFPYGVFHGARVKEDVYLPDWLDERRLTYTDRLARLLARLLPEGVDGSISTVPGAFRSRVRSREDTARMAELMLRHAETLFRLREETGKRIELSLEPEPCCAIETTDEAVAFFEAHLCSSSAVSRFAAATGLGAADAEAFLRRHLGVCLDACHAAVEHEEPREAARALMGAGIRIGKVQLSAGLQVDLSGRPGEDGALLAALEPFADDVYLHQVVERRGGALTRYVDLPQAFAAAHARGEGESREWRVHFHVPVFRERLEPFRSTQRALAELLALIRQEPVSDHLEVETYTWDVLPEEHRRVGVDEAIARELRWVLGELGEAEGGRP